MFAFGVTTNNVKITALEHWTGVAQTPAQQAGLEAGDTIVSVNGQPLHSVNTVHDVITRSAGKPVTLGVERDGQLRSIVGHAPGRAGGQGRQCDAGAVQLTRRRRATSGSTKVRPSESVNPSRAVGNAARPTWVRPPRPKFAALVHVFSPSGLELHLPPGDQLARRHPGGRPPRHLGAAGLARSAPATSASRPCTKASQSLLALLIVINIVFGLLNMLPIMPFDGGHVAVAVYEWIRTKKGQPYYQADITKLFPFWRPSSVFLALFVVSVVFLDIAHPLQNVFP